MGVWDIYESRMSVRGDSRRDISLKREIRRINNKSKDNLSYNRVLIDGIPQEITIINSDNLNEKIIISLPKKDLKLGGLVSWMDNYWLIIERDANVTVHTKAKMLQCNHLLKWVSEDNVVHEQWCVIEDGTKYLTGELEDRNFVVTRGDSRIAMTIARNELTVDFDRECRFLIDDPKSKHKLAYLLTKPLKTGLTYGNEGVFKFVLQEVVSTDNDNHELGIADYYKHFPKSTDNSNKDNSLINSNEIVDANTKRDDNIALNKEGKKVWL